MAERDIPNLLNTLIDDTSGGISIGDADYIAYTNTNSTTDTYVYKLGGSSGTTVATLTIVYVDSSKSQILTITRT